MNRSFARFLVAAALVLVAVSVGTLVACGDGEAADSAEAAGFEEVAPGEGWAVTLYLPDVRGALSAQEVALGVPSPGDEALATETAQAGQALVQALLEAEGDGLLPAVPGEVSVERIELGANGVAYVDLGGTPLALGTRGELLSVYSLVNTVAMNLGSVNSVVLLWNGNQRETFAGHIDTTRSLKPRPQLVREGGSSSAPSDDASLPEPEPENGTAADGASADSASADSEG